MRQRHDGVLSRGGRSVAGSYRLPALFVVGAVLALAGGLLAAEPAAPGVGWISSGAVAQGAIEFAVMLVTWIVSARVTTAVLKNQIASLKESMVSLATTLQGHGLDVKEIRADIQGVAQLSHEIRDERLQCETRCAKALGDVATKAATRSEFVSAIVHSSQSHAATMEAIRSMNSELRDTISNKVGNVHQRVNELASAVGRPTGSANP